MTEELTDLAATLEKQRQVMLVNLDGLSDEQMSTPSSLSAMPLLGIVQHLGYVERRWIHMGAGGQSHPGYYPPDPAKEFAVDGMLRDDVVAAYRAIADESDKIIASFPNGDAPAIATMGLNIRQVVLHLIEETARHAGQANVIREAIDGSVGT